MSLIETIIIRTPPANWLVVLLILYRGYRLTRPRVRPIRAYLLLPGLFILFSIANLAIGPDARTATGPLPLIALALALLAGAPLGWFAIAGQGFAVDHRQKRARVPGSWVPMLRYLFLFLSNDAIMVLTTQHLLPPGELALATNAVTGFTLGYFGLWLARFYRLYRTAPQTDLAIAKT